MPLFPPPTFFADDYLNLAELMLRYGKDGDVAIHFAREGTAQIEHVTWYQLRERIRRVRDALQSSGIQAGDVVAAVISNSVDAIVICVASLSLGAVWSSSSPDLGIEGIVDRYGQVDPKIVFADDAYIYAGRTVNLADRILKWSCSIGKMSKDLRDVVILPYCSMAFDASNVYHGCTFESFLARGTGRELSFSFMPFSHPAFILYSSGTVSVPPFVLSSRNAPLIRTIQTGKPKCMIHSAGVSLPVEVFSYGGIDVTKYVGGGIEGEDRHGFAT